MKLLTRTLILIFLMLPIYVSASSVTCEYTYKTTTVKVHYSYGNKISYTSEYSNNNTNYTVESMLITNQDIVDSNGNINCPKVTITTRSTGQKNRYKMTIKPDDNGKITGVKTNLVDDGKEKESSSSGNTGCIYYKGTDHQYTVYWNNDKVKVDLDGKKFENYCETLIQATFSSTDFVNGKCPTLHDQIVARYEDLSGCKGRLIISKNTILIEGEQTTEADGVLDIDSNQQITSEDVTDLPNIPNLSPVTDCKSLLGSPDDKPTGDIPGSPAYYISFILKIMRYVAIVILIALSVIDYSKAVYSKDSDAITKSMSSAIKRLIICVIIFFIPTLIEVILKYVHTVATDTCGIN